MLSSNGKEFGMEILHWNWSGTIQIVDGLLSENLPITLHADCALQRAVAKTMRLLRNSFMELWVENYLIFVDRDNGGLCDDYRLFLAQIFCKHGRDLNGKIEASQGIYKLKYVLITDKPMLMFGIFH